jgi:hypothetical protein
MSIRNVYQNAWSFFATIGAKKKRKGQKVYLSKIIQKQQLKLNSWKRGNLIKVHHMQVWKYHNKTSLYN